MTAPSPLPPDLADEVRPWGGIVYCHVPAANRFAIGALPKPDDGHDRWGTPRERTVYFAGDVAVALIEYARHRQPGAPDDERRLMRLRLAAVTVLDIRRPAVISAFGLPSPTGGVVDRERARQIAADVRSSGICQGLVVPSAGFVDRPDRFNVILFAECLGRDLEELVSEHEEVGTVRIAGG